MSFPVFPPAAFSHQIRTAANVRGRKQPGFSLPEFCIVFPYATQNAKQKLKLEAEVLVRLIRVGRRQRGAVTEQESEESCPGPPLSLSQAAAQRETEEGERRGGPTDCPITTPAEKPGGFFGFPERAIIYFFEMLFPYLSKYILSESPSSFGSFPVQSCSFHAGGCSVSRCVVADRAQEELNWTAGKLPYSMSP